MGIMEVNKDESTVTFMAAFRTVSGGMTRISPETSMTSAASTIFGLPLETIPNVGSLILL